MLEGATASAGEIVDVAGDLVGHHQRQVRVRGLDFGFRFSLYVEVNRESDLVRFVDGSRLRLLFGKTVSFLQSHQFRTIHALEDAVEFML